MLCAPVIAIFLLAPQEACYFPASMLYPCCGLHAIPFAGISTCKTSSSFKTQYKGHKAFPSVSTYPQIGFYCRGLCFPTLMVFISYHLFFLFFFFNIYLFIWLCWILAAVCRIFFFFFQLRYVGSLVTACELLVAACGIYFLD